MEQQTLIFLGPQGSGKGTQVELLKRYLTERDPSRLVAYFEAGAVLRQFSSGEGYTQERVRAILADGQFVPTFITSRLMSDTLIATVKGSEHLIFDGFPREITQLMVFDGAMRFYERTDPTLLHITVSEDESVKRLLKRGRNDDTEESIRNRLAWTRKLTTPAVDWYRANPYYRVVDIDGERSIEEIHADIVGRLGLK